MRVSSYVIGAPLRDTRFSIVAHGYTGAIDKVTREIGDYLVARRGKGLDGDSQITRDPALMSLLEGRGYLTTATAEEEREHLVKIARTLHILDLQSAPPSFMFVPAYLCNLRCPYCFQSHDLHAGKGRYGVMLSRELVDAAFSSMQEVLAAGSLSAAVGLSDAPVDEVPNSPPPHIGLFGGEPLMRETVGIVHYILERTAEIGGTLNAVTNGVELDLFKNLLGPDKIAALQITIDGLPGYHDRRRTGGRYRGTFETIAANVDMALALGVQCTIRVNVDTANVDSLQALNDLFADRGWSSHSGFSSYAAAVHNAGEAEQLSSSSGIRLHPQPYKREVLTPAQLLSQTSGLRRVEGSHPLESYERFARDFLAAVLTNDGYPFKKVAHCSSETGLLLFDPLGDLYSCWEDVGIPERKVGTYGSSGLSLKPEVLRQWLSRFPGAIDECSRCPYALIHTSGCARHAAQANGTLFAPSCESFQEYFPSSLATLYGLLEAALTAGELPQSDKN